MRAKIAVLAGSREQFERYLDANGLTDSEAFYAFEPRQLYGVRLTKTEIVGTFWERRDASELYSLARTRLPPNTQDND